MRHGLKVTLPKTDLQYQKVVQDIVITIDKQGNYFWHDDVVAPENLATMISLCAQKNECKTVFIRADKDVVLPTEKC